MALNVNIRNQDVMRLINARASAEGRSAENAANQTIREALEPIYGEHGSQDRGNQQAKNRSNFLEGTVTK